MGKTKIKHTTKKAPDLFEVVRKRLDGIRHLLDDMNESESLQVIRRILKAKRIFVSGKGRSGLIAESIAMRLMQMGFDVHVPGEATCPKITRGDMMLAISCSGSTMTTVELARIARNAKAKVAAVTAVHGSALDKLADDTVLIPVTDKVVRKKYRYVLGPYNNTLFEEALLLYFDAMIYAILESEGIPKRMINVRHTNLE
jgi:6-phospho-3-hexuloisomerase